MITIEDLIAYKEQTKEQISTLESKRSDELTNLDFATTEYEENLLKELKQKVSEYKDTKVKEIEKSYYEKSVELKGMLGAVDSLIAKNSLNENVANTVPTEQ